MYAKIKKRDGRIVDFDLQRIISAIEKSMRETVDGVDEKLAKIIAARVKSEIDDKTETISVETIQDLVEEKLMSSSRKDVAKNYILYRDNRTKNRVRNVVCNLFKLKRQGRQNNRRARSL